MKENDALSRDAIRGCRFWGVLWGAAAIVAFGAAVNPSAQSPAAASGIGILLLAIGFAVFSFPDASPQFRAKVIGFIRGIGGIVWGLAAIVGLVACIATGATIFLWALFAAPLIVLVLLLVLG